MPGITLAEAQGMLDALLALSPTERKVQYKDRTVEYHSRAEVLAEIQFWDGKVKELSVTAGAASSRVTRSAPTW